MSKTTAFILGGLVGASLALLYAPRAGQETRTAVTETAQSKWNAAVESGKVPYACQTACETAAVKGQELIAKAGAFAREAAEGAKPVFDERSDDLREKIEAARQRIAAQITQNAENAVASEEIEVEVEVMPAGESQAAAEEKAAEEKAAE